MSKRDIRELIQYNPDTGSLKWISSGPGRKLYGPAGYYDKRGYQRIRINGVVYQAARIAWYLSYGEWPKGDVDHIDQNPSNNKLDNLRDISHHLNTLHSRGFSKKGFPKGVDKRGSGYRVQATMLGARVYLGTYETMEEATAVAEAAHRKQ